MNAMTLSGPAPRAAHPMQNPGAARVSRLAAVFAATDPAAGVDVSGSGRKAGKYEEPRRSNDHG
jgi:hypothetical protein